MNNKKVGNEYEVTVMTKEHAEKYKKDNELPSDALVIEIKEE